MRRRCYRVPPEVKPLGTLFSALDIGRAGLLVAQVQLDVAGHNIANVNKEGYSRQRVEITTRIPNYKPYGAIGRGPALEGIRRLRDTFLDTMYRQQVAGLGDADVQAQYYTRIEDLFQEPSENGFGSRLNVFFDALNDFANTVEQLPARVALLSQAEAMAASLNDAASRLETLRTNANEEVRNLVPQINSLAERIAELNRNIRDAEFTGHQANDLRDDRDNLVDQLARLVAITDREREDGQVDILIGGVELVAGNKFHELETVVDTTIDPDRPDLLTVRFAYNGEPVLITGGELYGALHIRDVEIAALEDRMDAIAQSLIRRINSIHSQGNGLQNISSALTSTNPVNTPLAPLNLADLPFSTVDGSFDIVVYDAIGAIVETITVPIVTTGPSAGQTTLTDIETAINASANLSALIGPDGLITITPNAGVSFTFANDSSGALAALGLNGLFTGYSAGTIAVSQHLLDNPELLSSGFSLDPLETGDNTAALALAAVRDEEILEGDTQTLNEYYEATIVKIGIRAGSNLATLDVERAFVQDFDNRRQEISGVNLDEEATSLIQFQRAYQAAARLITVTDTMLETLVNLVR